MRKLFCLVLFVILAFLFCGCSNVGGSTKGHGDVTIQLINGHYYTYSDVDFEFVNETMVKISGVFDAQIKDENGVSSSSNTEKIQHTFYVSIPNVYSISINDYDKSKYSITP